YANTAQDTLVHQYADFSDNTELYEFTLKDVIGINKKLLGRSRSDYLCIPCLAEYAEASEAQLWDMVHDFKEQGCELFA
ncbi:MAG: hypothetical protein NC078_01785, partial [Ruminococcus sp.]|nr:hypothetical protein [Ruminococcus sp.]